MSNQDIAEVLEQTAKLMSLHDENSFKVKSYQSAAFKLERLQETLVGKSISELEKVDGIGKSLSSKIFELLIEMKSVTNIQNSEGNTPLHIYCKNKSVCLEVINLFLENKSDINLINNAR